MKVHEAAAHLCKLLQVQSVDSSHQSPPMGTYERQTIRTPVRLGILSNVPVWHPRAHDAKRKQLLRNPDDGEHVWMRIELALFDHATVYLVLSELSSPPME